MVAIPRPGAMRAWNDPARMIGVAGIRGEARGAFAEPALGRVRFQDWIHRIYIVNGSAVVEINQKFHGWGGITTTVTSGCSPGGTVDRG